MGRSVVPPDWTLADVREHAHAWREPRPFARAVLSVVVFAVVLGVASLADGGGSGSSDWAPFFRSLVNGAAVGLALGLAAGHVQAARTGYVGHALALPRVLRGTVRPVGPFEGTSVVLIGLTLGFGLPPLAAIALGLALVLLAPTGPGTATASALARAVDAIGDEAGVGPLRPLAFGSVLVFGGALTVAIAAWRAVAATEAACGLDAMGAPCGTDGAMVLAVAAGVASWVTTPIGAAISHSLDVALGRRPADGLAVTIEADVLAEELELDRRDLDELVALVRERFTELSDGTRRDVVALVARTLDDDTEVRDGDDVLDTLEDAVREAGPERTVEAIAGLREHVGTIDGLRATYQRTPKLARGAVERTATTALRTAGTPRDVAGPAVRALLTMPASDWSVVTGTLDDVTARFDAAG